MVVFCRQCGAENQEDATACQACSADLRPEVAGASAAPSPQASSSKLIGNVIIGAVCLIYLINPTAGVFEIIPDNLPIIGNLDEAAAMTGLLMVLSNLGVIPWKRT